MKDWEETGRNWANPGAEGENLRFFDFPAYFLMGLAGLAKQGMVRNHLEPCGLSMPEWRLLSTVAECSPIRFSRIAHLTAMDKAQVSRALRTAQGKGLVASSLQSVELTLVSPGQPPAARRVHVSITAAGRELFERVMPAVQRDQLRMLEVMSAEERRIVIRLARRLFAQLNEEGALPASGRSLPGEAGEMAAGALG
jgi:DNA-binding MarR family transcriptional regulator